MDWSNRWFLCKNCNAYIRTPKAFVDHKKNHCRNLHSNTAIKAGLVRHRNVSGSMGTAQSQSLQQTLKILRCKFCKYSTTTNAFMVLHSQKHNNKERVATSTKFLCKLCNQTFQWSNLESHCRAHVGETPFKCEYCSASFNHQSSLDYHLLNLHEHQRKKCRPLTHNPLSSKIHIPTHTGETPYKCKLCNSTSTKPENLQAHIRTHTGEKPYKCQQCTYAPSSLSGTGLCTHRLRIHEKEEGLFKGSSSKYAAADSSLLKRQRNTRSIHYQKAFRCGHCDYASYNNGNLKKHMKIHNC